MPRAASNDNGSSRPAALATAASLSAIAGSSGFALAGQAVLQLALESFQGALREDIHHARDRVGAVERRPRPADDLQPAGARDVQLVECVVVEEARRPDGDAVLEEEVDGLRRERLPDRGGVALMDVFSSTIPTCAAILSLRVFRPRAILIP